MGSVVIQDISGGGAGVQGYLGTVLDQDTIRPATTSAPASGMFPDLDSTVAHTWKKGKYQTKNFLAFYNGQTRP